MQLGDNILVSVSQATNLQVSVKDKRSVTYLQCISSEQHLIVSHDVDCRLAILLKALNDFLEKEKLTANIVIHTDSKINSE